MLVEDKYPSSDSDEEGKVKEIYKLKQSKNILNKKMSEKMIELTDKQQSILEKIEETNKLRLKDETILKKKRA